MKNSSLLPLLRFIGHQDWLRVGIRDRIIRFFCHPDNNIDFEFMIDFYGLNYIGNLNNFIDWTVYFYGACEKQVLLLLRDIAVKINNPVFIDIGANVGQYSLFMSLLCKEVHSFEPYEKPRKIFLNKIAASKISNIFVHNVALGDEMKEMDFYAPTGCNLGTGSFLLNHARGYNKYYKKLKIVKGDEYLRQLNLSKIDIIKIDVEGFEKQVLIGLKETLEKYNPVILMEYSKTTSNYILNLEQLKKLLPAGYKFYKLLVNRNIFWGFLKSTCLLELLSKCNLKDGIDIMIDKDNIIPNKYKMRV